MDEHYLGPEPDPEASKPSGKEDDIHYVDP